MSRSTPSISMSSDSRSWCGPVMGETLLDGNGTLHHLGIVVASISSAAEEFSRCMSARWDGQVIHDPLQRVRVAFFTPNQAQNPVFELVEPAEPRSTVSNFLNRGGGLHHVCYEINDMESAVRRAKEVGLIVVARAAPAVAFQGRRIAWLSSTNRLLIELLERHN